MCPLKVDLLFVTFDPETAEIRSVIMTHLMKIQHFRQRASHTKVTEPRLTKFCQMLEGLMSLLSTVKIWGKAPEIFGGICKSTTLPTYWPSLVEIL